MKCQICNNNLENININNEDFYICKYCKFLSRINILDENKEKERYDYHIVDDSYKEYMNSIYDKIKDYIKGTCLDFGCGKTHTLADIISVKNNCYYYDYYYYKELKNIKYDTIILVEVIEHIKDINELFVKFNSLINKDGNLIILTNYLKENLDNWWYLRDKTHISIFNSKVFKLLADKYNYDILFDNVKDMIVLKKIA